jgi:hypothetical protein
VLNTAKFLHKDLTDKSAMITWSGYDVPGRILLHDFKGAMRLDRSKDISVHV